MGCLGLLLPVLGFLVGLGYQTTHHVPPPAPRPVPSALTPPLVKFMVMSPDDRRLAFTVVYRDGGQAARCIWELRTGKLTSTLCPRGWEDFLVQWTADSRALVFQREKLPRDSDSKARAGLYRVPFDQPGREQPLVGNGVAPEEKPISGALLADGTVMVKTRREPKALFIAHGPRIEVWDRSPGTYLQNRLVQEQGRPVLYVVRDTPPQRDNPRLWRITGPRTFRALTEPLGRLVWAYVEEQQARHLLTCSDPGDGANWLWKLYAIGPGQARFMNQRQIPQDANSVFWSPDGNRVLAAGGEQLWLVGIPGLVVRPLGTRRDWYADDATWMHHRQAVVVASGGVLWQVGIPGGTAQQLLKLPEKFWR